MHRPNPWLLAARPNTLPAAVVPVLVGSALAFRDGAFQPLAALAALFAAVCIQIGTNLANDVHDFKKGADTTRVGPTRVTTAGLLTPEAVERGMWLVFGLAALAGLYLVYVGGWPILLIGVASILAGLAYTAGPFPLGYNGLGDVFVFLFFGLAGVMGTYYVQALSVNWPSFLAAIPVGALTTNIIVVNNVRDADTDRAVGKRTLAVLLGRDAARAEYALLVAVAYLTPLVLWLGYGLPVWTLLPWITLPWAVSLTRMVYTVLGPGLNKGLVGTARLLAVFGVLFALGIVL
ncbi:MAG: 1,4-dihydroxy-2-naphthoate polyprenyltransferase [Anaerolineae bacterium]|nr:1,4-dihydroxy-2-naphthoate polyprenyltransferase [Anaerolineae bacterium]